MKIRTAAVLTTSALLAGFAWGGAVPDTAPATAPATSPFKSDKEKTSYVVGMQIGGSLKEAGIDIDMAGLSAGIQDTLTGAKPQLSQQEAMETVKALQKQMEAKQMADEAAAVEAQKKAADVNLKAGEAFLADNAKKDGVKTTASGLQYKVLKTGAGKTPKATDTVSVKYRGTLISGKEFDSALDEPATFPVGGVIPGWTEALQLMKEGDKWQVVIPSKLAYGARGAGGAIGPNEVLVFEVELMAVKAPDAKP